MDILNLSPEEYADSNGRLFSKVKLWHKRSKKRVALLQPL